MAGTTYGLAWRVRAQASGFGSVVAIPISLEEQVVAVLTVFGREALAFDGTSEDLLATFGAALGLGMAPVCDVERMDAAFNETLSALDAMSEAGHPYSASHQHRVDLSGETNATHMGFATGGTSPIRQAGEVQDIGKFAVPAEILTPPGRLEPEGWPPVRRHPEVGASILAEAGVPRPIVEVALQHHERLDGSGCPTGVTGDTISLAARIVIVADGVEAMTLQRPYRPALGLDAALVVIRDGARTVFDPSAVESCLALLASRHAL